LSGILLDSHALYWLVSGDAELRDEALVAIGENQHAGTLFVSPITAWELAIASRKGRSAGQPRLGTDSPERWFREAMSVTSARIIPIRQRVSLAAANVVTETGHKDPGDCFLIASARIRRMPIVTRDQFIRNG
jgi:PIN domain nuclease of toxin-antitoxin system